MLVGALIFVLGIDLVKEALWDTRHRVNRSEYLTIVSIMVCMTLWDFVVGVLFGIIVCCAYLLPEIESCMAEFCPMNRFLLCRTELATSQYSSDVHRRVCNVSRSSTECSS